MATKSKNFQTNWLTILQSCTGRHSKLDCTAYNLTYCTNYTDAKNILMMQTTLKLPGKSATKD